MRNILVITLLSIIVFSSCSGASSNKDSNAAILTGEDAAILKKIKEKGELTALTTYSATSYFLYRGETMGFEYELLERFADYLGVELNIVVSQNIDSMLIQLKNGEVDLVAHGLTITSDRKEQVWFTDYLHLTHQVLVQRKPDNWRRMGWSSIQKELVHDAIELIDDTVSVRKNSSYHERLENLSEEIGGKIHIDTLPGNLSTDRIIKMVVDGDIRYTIADNDIANINASYYHNLNIDVPISFSQRVAWAVAPGATDLLEKANSWMQEIKDNVDYYKIYNKYFKNRRNFRKRTQSEFYSLTNNSISQYDELIKQQADTLAWDWRLMASLIYQESRFNPQAKSWAGAGGLMQIMPKTAESLGLDDRFDPEKSIQAGRAYLQTLWGYFKEIDDPVQRIKFTLASYNCGYQHVLDAQTLAEINELDSNQWDNNVEDMILELSYPSNYNRPEIKYGYVRGIEPYTYVQQIFERYEHYVQFIEV